MKIKIIFKYIIIFFLILPLFLMIGWSIVSSWPWPVIIPREFTLRGFIYILSPYTQGFIILLRSVVLSLVVTLITLIISIPAARAIAFYNFKGKALVKVLILLPLIVPILSVAMGIHLSFIRLGFANNYIGVILIHVIPGIPYGVKILLNIFEINGDKIETQGRVLGATPLQVMLHVTLPLLTPGLIIAGSIIYIISFSQYFITFLIGGGRIVTYAMLLFPFVESGDRTMASAISIIFILSIIIVLIISEKLVANFYARSSKYYV